MPMHFINILDHDAETLARLLDRAATLKKRRAAGVVEHALEGRVLAMFFEKPSMRTRMSLQAAIASMGGTAIVEDGGVSLGRREAVKDTARVVSRYADLVALRTFSHADVEEFAAHASVPVINALSDRSHPTQAMADILTLRERWGDCREKRIVFVGDGNNVARSLAAAAGRFGARFTLACPEGFGFEADFRSLLARECPALDYRELHDPAAAVRDADALYTDVWASMGQEKEAEERKRAFAAFQVNGALLARAPERCLILHCLPAHRGEEITDEAMESPRSVVFDQAENRMHFYRGLFVEALGM